MRYLWYTKNNAPCLGKNMPSLTNRFIKLILPFLSAWLVAFLLASVFHSCFVLYGLIVIDIDINTASAFSMIFQDITGLLPTYGVIIAAALLIAFTFARFVFLKQSTTTSLSILVFALSGATAFMVMLAAMQPILDVTLIAGARTTMGIFAQCASGFVGGALFGKLK